MSSPCFTTSSISTSVVQSQPYFEVHRVVTQDYIITSTECFCPEVHLEICDRWPSLTDLWDLCGRIERTAHPVGAFTPLAGGKAMCFQSGLDLYAGKCSGIRTTATGIVCVHAISGPLLSSKPQTSSTSPLLDMVQPTCYFFMQKTIAAREICARFRLLSLSTIRQVSIMSWQKD